MTKMEICTETDDRKLKLPDAIQIGGKLFLEGFTAQLKDEGTIGTSIGAGLWAGLKYKGSLVRGVKTGIVTELVFCTANGIRNVLHNYRKVKRGEHKYMKFTEESE